MEDKIMSITPEEELKQDKDLFTSLLGLRNWFFDTYPIKHGNTRDEGLDNIKKYVESLSPKPIDKIKREHNTKRMNKMCPECGCIGDCWKHGTKPINEGITLEQAEAYMTNKHKADIIQGALEARIEDREKTKALMEYTGDTKLWYEDNEEKLSQLKSQLSQEIMK